MTMTWPNKTQRRVLRELAEVTIHGSDLHENDLGRAPVHARGGGSPSPAGAGRSRNGGGSTVTSVSFPGPINFDYSTKVPRRPEFTKDLDDCAPDDLQYLIDYRKGLAERTGGEHDERCQAEILFSQRMVDTTRARAVSVFRELPADTPMLKREAGK